MIGCVVLSLMAGAASLMVLWRFLEGNEITRINQVAYVEKHWLSGETRICEAFSRVSRAETHSWRAWK